MADNKHAGFCLFNAFFRQDGAVFLEGIGSICFDDHLGIICTNDLVEVAHERVDEVGVCVFVTGKALFRFLLEQELVERENTLVQVAFVWLHYSHVDEGKEVGVRVQIMEISFLLPFDEQVLRFDLLVICVPRVGGPNFAFARTVVIASSKGYPIVLVKSSEPTWICQRR